MSGFLPHPIPAPAVGIGLKPEHYKAAAPGNHGLDFFEVHAENFMGAGGPPHRWLTAFRMDHALSVHGVGLSIGGRDPLDEEHLSRLAAVVARYEPALVSEHFAWNADGGVFFNDLLPPPLTDASLVRVCDHVSQTQDALRRRILIENPSSYLAVGSAGVGEPEFLNELARRTGCGVLFDVNNVYVSACNLGFDAAQYIDEIDPVHVGEIHLAGHAIDNFEGVEIRVDNHGERIGAPVLDLYARFIARAGARPTLIERDANIPAFEALVDEARQVRSVMTYAASREVLSDPV